MVSINQTALDDAKLMGQPQIMLLASRTGRTSSDRAYRSTLEDRLHKLTFRVCYKNSTQVLSGS